VNVQLGTGGGIFDTNGFSTQITQGIANVSGQTGSLTKQGSGTLTLSGNNSYTGGTTVAAGTLVAGTAGALSTGSVSLNGGALELSSTLTLGASLTSTNTADTLKFDLAPAVNSSSAAITLSGGNYDFHLATSFTIDLNNQFSTPGLYHLIAGGTGNADFLGTYNIINSNSNDSYSFSNGDLLVQTVPEPGAVVSLIGGIGMLLGLQRRRRNCVMA
jgi:autotransporter-associated beta strand protein